MIHKNTLFKEMRYISHKVNKKIIPIDQICLKRRNIKQPPPLFIVGVPRAGTTLTYQMITQQLKVGYFIEAMNLFFGCPNFILRLVSKFTHRPHPIFTSHYGKTNYFLAPAESGTFWLRWLPQSYEMGHHNNPDQFKLKKYKYLISTVESMSQIFQKPMVFKSVYLDMNIGLLTKIFPSARFIFVKRDLFYNCQSLIIARQKQPDPSEWWSVKPPYYRRWLSQPIWQQVANQAYVTQRILERDLQEYALGRFFEIKYEQICNYPHKFISEITNWLKPLGYISYMDIRVPKTFESSDKIRLDDYIVENLLQYLRILEYNNNIAIWPNYNEN